jgi:hypothetical protein
MISEDWVMANVAGIVNKELRNAACVSTCSPCLPANKADFWNVDIRPTEDRAQWIKDYCTA